MFLFDGIFNGADLLMYIALFGGVYVWYRRAKRKQEQQDEEQ